MKEQQLPLQLNFIVSRKQKRQILRELFSVKREVVLEGEGAMAIDTSLVKREIQIQETYVKRV